MYFRYWLGIRSVDDERQINRWKRIVTIFKGKLVKMIKDANGRFDDYSISPKIRQILLHWGYELAESDLLRKAAEYYRENADLTRLEAKNKYRNLSETEKNKKRKYQRERYHMNTDLNEKLKQYQRNYYASKKVKK